MSRYAVSVLYERHDQGRVSYKLRLEFVEASSHAEALGKQIIADNPKNHGSVGLWAVNHIPDHEPNSNETEDQKEKHNDA